MGQRVGTGRKGIAEVVEQSARWTCHSFRLQALAGPIEAFEDHLRVEVPFEREFEIA